MSDPSDGRAPGQKSEDPMPGAVVPPGPKPRRRVQFYAAAIVAVIITGIAYREWRHFSHAHADAVQARVAVDSVERLLTALMDAESAQRGFLLSGDDRYLEPYRRAAQQIPQELAAVSRVLAAQPQQAANAARLSTLTADALAEIRDTIALRRARGISAATAVALSDGSKQMMDEIRALCSRIRHDEISTQTEDYAEADAIAGTVLLATITGSLVLFFLFALAVEPFASPSRTAWGRPWPQRYGAAIASVAGITLLRGALTPLIGPKNLPFTLFFCAVAFSAWYGGFQPAVLSIALSLAAGAYFFAEPTGTLLVKDRDDQVAMLMMVVVGFGVALLSRSQRSSVGRAMEAENSERTQRQWLEITLGSIADAVIATDERGAITFLNGVASEVTGWRAADALGRPLDEVFPVASEGGARRGESPVRKVLQTGSMVGPGNYTAVSPSGGREIPFEISGAPIRDREGNLVGAVIVFRDVSERRAAEAERERLTNEVQKGEIRLREAAKLESLGVLAGGVAHDFNNLLVGIIGGASLALDMVPDKEPAHEVIEQVLSASEKAATLTRQMLAYSGKSKFLVGPFDLSRCVEDTIPLLARAHPAVRVEARLQPGLPAIEADRSQIEQLVLNLILNAIEACPAEGGTVAVSTDCLDAAPDQLSAEFGLAQPNPGPYVRLEVRDNGSGMTDEVRERMFDPFFTTKFTGRGLGLSAVLGIIRGHGGAMHVETAPGRGTTFRVYLPATRREVEAGRTEPNLTELRGKGTILVADDEEVVRQVTRASLERCGYEVITVENGEEAVRTFRENPGRIDLIILDLTMPVMGGEAALDQILKIDGSVRILLSSGFSLSEAAERFRGKPICGFLQKPYTSATLAETVLPLLSADLPGALI